MLVILPGLLCNSTMFAGQLRAIPDSKCIDGFYGGSRRLEEMARYVVERCPERMTLLGHSMGARVAFEIIRRVPERVERLIVADTGIHPVKPEEREKRHALLDHGRTYGIEALVDQWLPPMLAERSLKNDALVRALRAMCIKAGLASYERQIEALLHRPEVAPLLPHIACPTLVVVGREDRWSPVGQHEEIASSIPRADLSIVEGAGHMMPAEAPDAFNQLVTAWLAS